ncbi:uncharacterized protein LOC121503791 [Xyrichtys novacula]|uniref:Uncharacterized protein LOC121503791 n=1 Tax=Xyrichtys novacula TaxID=13765 RepID=A0AAV1GRL9_XYRNO|nr:uncharacterized protein LOC121503791 [Xyrichtys novacula]
MGNQLAGVRGSWSWTTRANGKLQQLDSRRPRESKNPPNWDKLHNSRKETETSTKTPPTNCTEGEIWAVIHGKFTIVGLLESNTPHAGFQSDSAVSAQSKDGQRGVKGQQHSDSEESWQRLQPVVECGDKAMTLTVRRRRAVQLLLDRENKSSLPLSQLSPECGYSVLSTWKDLSLVAHYDACHVTQEDDHYVLPLLWRGTPVRVSCPTSQMEPQAAGPSSPCCSPYGLTVKVQGLPDAEELRVNVRGEWTPLEALAEQCGYTVDRGDAEIIFTAPYIACGITVKGGKHTLALQIREKIFTLTCPVFGPEDPPLTNQPPIDSYAQQTEHKPQSNEPLPWAPPFYLAPPHYPHPTYHHTHPPHNTKLPPTPQPPTPGPVFVPRAHPPVHDQTYNTQQEAEQDYSSHLDAQISPPSSDHVKDTSKERQDLLTKPETPNSAHSPASEAGFPTQVEAPPLQQLSNAFAQYYHYYHHPKIPLDGPAKDPDPGPRIPKEQPPRPVSPESFPSAQPSEAAPDPHSPPASPGFSHKTSRSINPHPPPHYPHHYFYYFPHTARDEAERPPPPDSKEDDQHSKSSSFLLENSSEHNLNPYAEKPKPDEVKNVHSKSAERLQLPFLSDEEDDGEVADVAANPRSFPPDPDPVPTPEQPPLPSPASSYHHPLYPYYLHLYYYYYYLHLYQQYFGTGSLPSNPDHVSPTPSKQALDPLHQTSFTPPEHPSSQTSTPPTKPKDDSHDPHLHPYYHSDFHYHPVESVDNQEPHPAERSSSESESYPPSHTDDIERDPWLPTAEEGYPSMPLQLQSLYSYYMTQQHPNDPLEHPDGEEEKQVDSEMEDQLKADLYTPFASPCCLGCVSDIDCSTFPGCCLYLVEGCTTGQHFIFVVPDSAVESTVSFPAHPSEVFDQTDSYLFEDHGVHSFHQDPTSVQENYTGPDSDDK